MNVVPSTSARCPRLVLLLALLAPPACGPRQPPPAPPSAIRPPAIDAHLHTDFSGRPERTSGIVHSADQLRREMREAGIVGGISMIDQTGTGYVRELHQAGIVFCCGIGERTDPAEVEAGLRAGRYRCLKIYLGYVHRWASDARYEPFYQLAERHRVPVVFHTGDTYSTKAKLKYADPLTVDEVAVDHPRVTFVIAHVGNPWIQSAAEVAYKNQNVYLDGSAMLIGDLAGTAPDKVDELMVKPLRWIAGYLEDSHKLMFGTDWPLVGMKAYRAAFERAIPPADWKEVFHNNAVRVFRPPGVKLLP